ncbi:MAG: hypothetical protein PHT99_06165, partial [Methanoregula sp.]|nr:hypothetical protein [Methanoregula sp.]
YHFNISLRDTGQDQIRSVGEVVPENYGYIRRDVKIKQTSNATIDYTRINAFGYNNTEDVSFNQFSIVLNHTKLRDENIHNPAYQIDIFHERIIINITDLKETRSPLYPLPAFGDPGSNLTAVNFYQASSVQPLTGYTPPGKYLNFTYDDGTSTGEINSTPVTPPVDLRNNVSLIFEPGFFSNANVDADIYINLTFGMDTPQQYLNNTNNPNINNTASAPFDYNYIPTNVTQPCLKDAVLEVAVW